MSIEKKHSDRSFICPVCGTSLEPTSSHGVKLHSCTTCRGLWFDRRELSTFVHTLQQKESFGQNMGVEQFSVENSNDFKKHVSHKRCPRCDRELAEYNYAYNSNIYIDRCDQCDGIWIDGWELDQLTNYLRKAEDQLVIGNFILERHINLDQWQELKTVLDALNKRLTAWQRFLFYYFPPAVSGWLMKELHSSKYIYLIYAFAIGTIVLLGIVLFATLLV